MPTPVVSRSSWAEWYRPLWCDMRRKHAATGVSYQEQRLESSTQNRSSSCHKSAANDVLTGLQFRWNWKKINDDETQRGFSSVFLFLCVPIIRITFLLAVKCDESKRCYVIAEQSFTSHWRRWSVGFGLTSVARVHIRSNSDPDLYRHLVALLLPSHRLSRHVLVRLKYARKKRRDVRRQRLYARHRVRRSSSSTRPTDCAIAAWHAVAT